MKRLFVGVVVPLLALVVAPATAQPVDPQLSAPAVREGDGKVVVTVSKMHPGRIVYWTEDGCDLNRCRVSDATARNDYQPISGELVFATPGSQTVTIPIVDDNIAETEEAFMLSTNEGERAAGWPTRRSIELRIIDDDVDAGCTAGNCSGDGPRNPPAASGATTPATGGRARGPVAAASPGGAAVVDVGAATTTSAPPTVATVLASDDLHRGPGFEPTSGGPAGVALAVLALAGAAAFTIVRRGRRRSATRS